MAKKKKVPSSRYWSAKECKEMAKMIESYPESSRGEAYVATAAHFGVSKQAIQLKYCRYKKGEHNSMSQRSTTKIATPSPKKGKTYGPYNVKTKPAYEKEVVTKKKSKPSKVKPVKLTNERSMTLDMRDVVLDFKTMKIYVKY